MARRVDPRCIKVHYTRTVSEWATELGVHKNTILQWIKRDGLSAITDRKPWLICGVDLKTFLDKRKSNRKFEKSAGEMPCFSCRRGRRPGLGMLDYIPQDATSGRLQALCEVCGSVMYQGIRQIDISLKFPGCEVTTMRCQGTLSRSADNLVNGDKTTAARTRRKPLNNVVEFPAKRSA